MMISTRGRYALRVLIDLAEHDRGDYQPMKEVAARQEISLKYLEQILPVLTKNKFIEGVHGKGGGYRLTRAPETYRVGDVLKLTEGDLAPVSCLSEGASSCSRADNCRTLAMWRGFRDLTESYFNCITLADLMDGEPSDLYVI